MASASIRMNVNAAPVEPANNQKLLGVREDGELVQVEVDLGVGGVPQGIQGQIVGYDAQGNPVPVVAPTVSDPYDDTALVQALSQQGQRLTAAEEMLANVPEPVDLDPLTDRVTAVEQGLPGLANRVAAVEDVLSPIPGRLAAVEEGLAQVPPPYDDTALVQVVGAQEQRLTAVEQGLENIPDPVDLTPLTSRVAAVEAALSDLPEPADLGPLTSRVVAVETALSDLPDPPDLTPLTNRVAAVEAGLAQVAEPYDDAPIQAEIAQLKSRVDAIDGGFINRPPTSSPIPPQALTIGTAFSANFSGYFSDPDNQVLSALDVSGALPPGIVQDGFAFSGTPTTAGNFTVTLAVEDLYGAQASRTIAWTVQAVNAPKMTVTPAAGGIAVQNLGTFPDHTITAAIGGLSLEFA